jgi:hypothetical protein
MLSISVKARLSEAKVRQGEGYQLTISVIGRLSEAKVSVGKDFQKSNAVKADLRK